jgi:hypothetical protein
MGSTENYDILVIGSGEAGKYRGVSAELAIHGGDLPHRWAVVVGHDRRSWRYDCYI